MKIYTRKGDSGETRNGRGERVLKCDYNIEAVGEVDELNAVLGLIKLLEVEKIQEDLMVIGAMISKIKYQKSKIKNLELRTMYFEKEIDGMWGKMPELKNFIIFGGTEKASLLFFARAVCRRAERAIVGLLCPDKSGHQPDDYETIIKYLNRLSDYLFCLGRYKNFKEGVKEKVWSVF